MSTIRAFTIQPGDTQATEVQLPTEDSDGLRALQGHVGGYVEAVNSSDGTTTFWCNEEGKIHDMEVNGLATAYWWAVSPEAVNVDTLRGTVVITGGFDSNGGTLPVTDKMARLLTETYVEGT